MSTPAAEQPANPQRTMQAVVFDDFGGPEVLVAREIPIPEVRPHDLLVRNAAIGVNRADLLHRKGAYGRAYFGDADTMGLEIAGTVVAMGPEVQGFAVGDRVMGIVGGGAYAELSRIDHRMAMPVPAGMDLVAAGAVAVVFVTARVRHGQGRQAWRRAGLGGRCVHRLPQRRLSGGGGAGHAGPGRGCGDRSTSSGLRTCSATCGRWPTAGAWCRWDYWGAHRVRSCPWMWCCTATCRSLAP